MNLPNGFQSLPSQFDTWREVPLTFSGLVGDAVDVSSRLSVTTFADSGYWGNAHVGDTDHLMLGSLGRLAGAWHRQAPDSNAPMRVPRTA